MAHRGRANADDRLAAELAAGKTVRDAATAAGIAERTAFRRLTDPAFKTRVREARSGMLRTAAGRLADGMTEAAGVLRSLLTHANAHIRHKAAVKIIELCVKVTELSELEEQVDELSARLNEIEAQPPSAQADAVA